MEIIEKEINKLNLEANKRELSLMMIDIDYFKNVNDTHGHLFGDYVLETLAHILVNNINDNGYVAFIIPTSINTSIYFEKIRRYIISNTEIISLYDFPQFVCLFSIIYPLLCLNLIS